MAYLKENGVDSRPFFIPLHTLPPFRQESARRKETLPATERISSAGFNLPTHADLTESDLDYICSIIREFAS